MYFTSAENIQSTSNGIASPIRDPCKRMSPWNQIVKKTQLVIAKIPNLPKSLGMYNWVSCSNGEMEHRYELNTDMNLEHLFQKYTIA